MRLIAASCLNLWTVLVLTSIEIFNRNGTYHPHVAVQNGQISNVEFSHHFPNFIHRLSFEAVIRLPMHDTAYTHCFAQPPAQGRSPFEVGGDSRARIYCLHRFRCFSMNFQRGWIEIVLRFPPTVSSSDSDSDREKDQE